MKKTLLFAGLLCSATLFSQTTLFSDDFESGDANWTLNDGSGDNQWIVNNLYSGYSPIIDDTPDEPVAITGSPQSNYLHIYSKTACSVLSVCNASFDTGSTTDQNATLSTPLVTTGMNTITFSLYYLCAGDPGTAYGTLQYSIDDGTSWIDAETYIGATTWTQESLTLPDWDDQATLTFRFNWINGGSGDDPAFSVDQLLITSGTGVSEAITNVVPDNSTEWCYNDQATFDVDFESAGTYTSGNVFTAELSDESGSFTSPTVLGTLNSTTSGNLTIPCTIPLGTDAGTGYRIRITSSDPAVISSVNNDDLEINALPTIDAGTDQTACEGHEVTLTASGASTYSWDNNVTDNVPFTPSADSIVFTVTGTDTYGCKNTDQVTVIVSPCAGIEENENSTSISIFPNPMNDHFTIESTTQISSIKVIDLSGRTMMTFEPTLSNVYSINGLTAGTYFVVISDGNSKFSKRIIKK